MSHRSDVLRVVCPLSIWFMSSGCSSHLAAIPSRADREEENVLITAAAAGWHVLQKRSDDGDRWPSTILVNPRGVLYDVGRTQFPDRVGSTLWRVRVRQLNADFLVLYTPPIASGGSVMTLFYLRGQDEPVRAADITHHYELTPERNSPVARLSDGRLLTDVLFADSDHDGIPELVEPDAYRWCGTITYHQFDGERFIPLWIEEYEAAEDAAYDLKLVARRRVDPDPAR